VPGIYLPKYTVVSQNWKRKFCNITS